MNSTQTFTVIDIVMAIFKSPIKFILWFLVFFSFVVLAYLVVPREYGSDGKLFVQVGRSSLGAGPTTSAGTISLQDSRETEVKSVVDLLASRELANKVVDKVGVERILKPNSSIGRFFNDLPAIEFGSGGVDESETELTSDEIKTLNRRNKAVKVLLQSVDLQHEKSTTVVSVAIKAQTPFLAQEIVQAYLDEYQKTHVKVNTPQAGGFFNEQLKLHKSELLESENKLEDFRSELNILDTASARSLLQREIDQLRLDALSTAVKLSEAQEKAFQIKGAFAKVPEFIKGADTRMSSLARDKAREALYNLELQESDLASRYNNSNPKLAAIRSTIKKAKVQLSKIPESFKQAQKSLNPAHKDILVMLTKASADADGFQKRLQATEALVQLKVSEVDRVNKLSVLENALVRDVDIQRKTMLSIAGKTAESATIDALDSERISNVKIAQAACLVPKKVFPSGLMFAILGGAVAALLATVMTFLKDFKIGYESDRRNRQRHLEQGHEQRSLRPAPSRRLEPARVPAMAHSGVVREDFHPSELATGDRPLHLELQEEANFESNYSEMSEQEVQAEIESQRRRRRAEQQVNILALVGGFAVLVAAYFFVFVFK